MLIFNNQHIGDKLLNIRKKRGLTQEQVAELAAMSDRCYADIERGEVTPRVSSLLRVCNALHITPDEILTEEAQLFTRTQEQLLLELEELTAEERNTALKLLSVYIDSLK